MSSKKLIKQNYVISKEGMADWFLYTVEKCSFGKRIEWTRNRKEALIFTSEEKVESFKERMLENVTVSICRYI